MTRSQNPPSKEVSILGNLLLYGGMTGFLVFYATTERIIDANVYFYAFIAVIGWFITQLKSWARKLAVTIFAIYAVGELAQIIFSFDTFFHLEVPLIHLGGGLTRFFIDCIFIFLLMKKSVRDQFILSTPDKNGVKS